MIEEGLRVEFDPSRGGGEAARHAICVRLSVFGVAGLQRNWHSAWDGTQLLERDAGRRELVAVSGINVAIPELRGKAEAHGEIEDDVGIGAGFTRRRNDRLSELDERLRLRADIESDL